MKIKTLATVLVITASTAGCSSMPSMPWSGSGTQSDGTAEGLYAEGIRYFNEKRYARTIDSLSKIKTDFPFSPP